MSDFFSKHTIEVGEKSDSPFLNKIDIYQDGTTPMYRDASGKLWAMSGHSHMGHIGMFCGTTLDDMKEVYPISTNFCVGHADYAFSGIRYPEGVKPRGSIWPFGLYICPKTNRFFCFFHNEAAWNSKGTGYDALGPCDVPHFDSDFRHIGLMHSDDCGRNWTFDRWVLTGNRVCFTEKYDPENSIAIGQSGPEVYLGTGDFSIFVEPEGEYIYLFYDTIRVDVEKGVWNGCDTYVARTRRREDGTMGDFVKYYNGSFCEAGNLGRETPIFMNAWHPRVVYSEKHGLFFASSCPARQNVGKGVIIDEMQVRYSSDMINWSEPITLERDGKVFGNHYVAMVSDDADRQPNFIKGDEFSILTNHNGTDVMRWKSKFVEK